MILVEDEGQIMEIDDIVLHPKYKPLNAYYDVAVVKLKPNDGELVPTEYPLKVLKFLKYSK